MITFMDRIVQTGIRISESLYERLKRNAKRERRSLNNYIAGLLEEATEPAIPHLNLADFKIDEDILAMGKTIGPIPKDRVQNDPRLKAMLGE